MNIVYFVPLTWPLNGMEFGIGEEGVDNGVTTSGKEVQEALVNVRLHGWAGSLCEASRVRAGQEKNTFLPCKGNVQSQTHTRRCRDTSPRA